MQVRLVARGCETVLADAASEAELFLTDDFLTRQVLFLPPTSPTDSWNTRNSFLCSTVHTDPREPKANAGCLLCSPVQNIQSKVDAAGLQRPWSLAERRQQLAEDEALRQHNQAAKEQATPQRFFWRSLYLPQQGMFCQAPRDLQLGTCHKVTGGTCSDKHSLNV